MTPRRRLPWGAAEWFGPTPQEGMPLVEAARVIADEYGTALSVLASETATAYGVPPSLRPLAWFRVAGVTPARCASCHTDVEVLPTLLRCPDCGRVASKPEWWSP